MARQIDNARPRRSGGSISLRTDGAGIRARRELMGLTQIEFAHLIGYSNRYLSQIERGEADAGPRFLRAAAKGLRCKIPDIASPKADGPRAQSA